MINVDCVQICTLKFGQYGFAADHKTFKSLITKQHDGMSSVSLYVIICFGRESHLQSSLGHISKFVMYVRVCVCVCSTKMDMCF